MNNTIQVRTGLNSGLKFAIFVLVLFGFNLISSPASAASRCNDSDGGQKVKLKGIVQGMSPNTGTTTIFTDACANSQVLEGYCDARGLVRNKIMPCPRGQVCRNGACAAVAIAKIVNVPTAAPKKAMPTWSRTALSFFDVYAIVKNYILKDITFTVEHEGIQLSDFKLRYPPQRQSYITSSAVQSVTPNKYRVTFSGINQTIYPGSVIRLVIYANTNDPRRSPTSTATVLVDKPGDFVSTANEIVSPFPVVGWRTTFIPPRR